MKILLAHNYYLNPGGEDNVFSLEKKLLAADNNNFVAEFTFHNELLSHQSLVRNAIETVWNRNSYKCLRSYIRVHKPDIIHFHNTFPIISPSAFYAAHAEKVPVIQTLHNYRTMCPNALLMHNGKVCEECINKVVPWPGVYYSCYRGSFVASAVTAAMLVLHRALGTYRNQVDVYVALTEFTRRKFIQGGIPAEKIVVKPNFVSADPGIRDRVGEYALFVGRLVPEKGVRTLLKAWRKIPEVPLKLVGDGPLTDELRSYILTQHLESVELLGRRDNTEVFDIMKSARLLIFPSEWYETFGMVVIEAYACELPVIASRIGAMEELVLDGETGLHFTPGDPEDLAEKVSRVWGDKELCSQMGRRARAEYEAKYTAERNYEQLMDIYRQAIASHR